MSYNQGFNLIGPDCKNIIMDYLSQLVITEKYDKVMVELKRSVYYHMISDCFSMLVFNKTTYHYYSSQQGYLMMIRYMDEGYLLEQYIHNRAIEVVYLFM